MIYKNRKKIILTSLVGGLICLILLGQIDPLEILHGLQNTIPLFFLIYSLLNVVLYLLRSLRFRLLIGSNAGIRDMFTIVSLHAMFINLFPFGTGELTYPYYLKKKNITSGLAEGVPSLLLARVFDVITVGIFLIVALFSVKKGLGELAWIGLVVVGGLLLLLALKLANKKKDTILSWLKSGCGRFQSKKYSSLIEKLTHVVGETLTGFEVLSRANVLISTLLLTVGCRFVGYLAVYYLFIGMRLPLDFVKVVLLSSLYIFLPILPLNTVAGIGTTEAFLVMILMSFGYSKDISVVAGFQLHILQLSVTVFLGLLGMLDMAIRNKNSKACMEAG